MGDRPARRVLHRTERCRCPLCGGVYPLVLTPKGWCCQLSRVPIIAFESEKDYVMALQEYEQPF